MKNIVKYPNKVLLTKCKPVDKVDETINDIMDCMLETMLTIGGVGLAAPQIGVQKRIIVAKPEEDELIVMANPEIIESNGEAIESEGCLSLPGANIKVKRASSIKVKGLDRSGKEIHLNLNGLHAAIIQHEIDHLDGITLLQRANYIQKRQMKLQMKKYNRLMKRKNKHK